MPVECLAPPQRFILPEGGFTHSVDTLSLVAEPIQTQYTLGELFVSPQSFVLPIPEEPFVISDRNSFATVATRKPLITTSGSSSQELDHVAPQIPDPIHPALQEAFMASPEGFDPSKLDSSKSRQEQADELGISIHKLKRWLKETDAPHRPVGGFNNPGANRKDVDLSNLDPSMTRQQQADALGISLKTLKERLKEAGAEHRSQGFQPGHENVHQSRDVDLSNLDPSMTRQQQADALGISVKTLTERLKEQGGELRSPGRRTNTQEAAPEFETPDLQTQLTDAQAEFRRLEGEYGRGSRIPQAYGRQTLDPLIHKWNATVSPDTTSTPDDGGFTTSTSTTPEGEGRSGNQRIVSMQEALRIAHNHCVEKWGEIGDNYVIVPAFGTDYYVPTDMYEQFQADGSIDAQGQVVNTDEQPATTEHQGWFDNPNNPFYVPPQESGNTTSNQPTNTTQTKEPTGWFDNPNSPFYVAPKESENTTSNQPANTEAKEPDGAWNDPNSIFYQPDTE